MHCILSNHLTKCFYSGFLKYGCTDELVKEILELDFKARENVPPKKRFFYDELKNARPFIALVGPRGAGKTVLLRQKITEFKEFFVYFFR